MTGRSTSSGWPICSSRRLKSAAVDAATTPFGARQARKARSRTGSGDRTVHAATTSGRTTSTISAASTRAAGRWSPSGPSSTPAASTMNRPPISRATTGSVNTRSWRTGTSCWLASARPIVVVANSPASGRTASATP